MMCNILSAQHRHKINAVLLDSTKTIQIEHEMTIFNESKDTITSIFLSDWNNAYASKKTALAKRFGEEFKKSLHLASKKERGYTRIYSITDKFQNYVEWSRLKQGDLLRVKLNFAINPYQSYTLKLLYTVTLPDSKFTEYGIKKNGNYNLRYWYILPAVKKNRKWNLYSNTDLDDQYVYASDYEINFEFPKKFRLSTDLDTISNTVGEINRKVRLKGDKRGDVKFYLEKKKSFEHFKNDKLTLITNLKSGGLTDIARAVSADQVVNFIHDNLGAYPHDNLLVSEVDYKKNPLYDINQLPKFLRPFPPDFQYELRLLKTALKNWQENSVFIDPRGERWVTDAIQTYLMIKYVDQYYPEMKLFGKVSDFFIFRSFNLAKLDFNDQYPFLSMLMTRRNQDQALTTPGDSLVKFNEKISTKYKAGIGLVYLDNYLQNNHIDNSLKAFYKKRKTQDISADTFIRALKKDSPKNIDWFFDSYVSSRDIIDFKIKKAKKIGDSVLVTLKNKTGTNVPITLYGIKKDSIVSKQWVTDIKDEKTFKINRNGAERLVLNYDKIIPEYNQRDNWKSLKGFFSSNKKLQFKFFKDAENPYYNQIFYVPSINFNVHDGLAPGIRFNNNTFLRRPFNFNIEPAYSSLEQTLVGRASINYRHDLRDTSKRLFRITYGISGSSFHFDDNARFSTITPRLSFTFRDYDDFRSNRFSRLLFRHVNVFRSRSTDTQTDPDYSIFNARYTHTNNGIINFFSWFTDFQLSNNFSKLAFSLRYRRLFQNNRQLNIRLFAGKFISNETNSDFFSFALDRPTDYLFDFNYLARSGDRGIFGQQIIIAEGGFKSRLEDPFSDDWIITANGSFNIWRWVELYGDIGTLSRQNGRVRFVYDSGVRLNLLTDFFELYFPLYSTNGFEPSLPAYGRQIRFVITLSPNTLIGLFTRKWF